MTWLKATKFGKLPSQVLDPSHAWDDLTRYQIDNAVTFFGLTIEGALQERIERGSGGNKRWSPRYTLSELLDDKFQFPREGDDLSMIKGSEFYDEVSA